MMFLPTSTIVVKYWGNLFIDTLFADFDIGSLNLTVVQEPWMQPKSAALVLRWLVRGCWHTGDTGGRHCFRFSCVVALTVFRVLMSISHKGWHKTDTPICGNFGGDNTWKYDNLSGILRFPVYPFKNTVAIPLGNLGRRPLLHTPCRSVAEVELLNRNYQWETKSLPILRDLKPSNFGVFFFLSWSRLMALYACGTGRSTWHFAFSGNYDVQQCQCFDPDFDP